MGVRVATQLLRREGGMRQASPLRMSWGPTLARTLRRQRSLQAPEQVLWTGVGKVPKGVVGIHTVNALEGVVAIEGGTSVGLAWGP